MTKPATRICAECRTSFEPRGGWVLGFAVYVVTYAGVATIAELAHMATIPTVLMYGSGVVMGWATERWAVARHRATCPACGARRTVPRDTPVGAALILPGSPAVDAAAHVDLPQVPEGRSSPQYPPERAPQPELRGPSGTLVVLGLLALLVVGGYATREITERVDANRHRQLTASEARAEVAQLLRERQRLVAEADEDARKLDETALKEVLLRVKEIDQRCEDVTRRAPKYLWDLDPGPHVGEGNAGASPGR